MYLITQKKPAPNPAWVPPPLHEKEFGRLRGLLFQWAGISMNDSKKALVSSRLETRLRQLEMRSFSDYCQRVEENDDERQIMVDLLTTNETHFFREPRHFEYLSAHILPTLPRSGNIKVWSAACSTGEEVYSLAMTLSEHTGHENWKVHGSDISRRVLDVANKAVYPMASASEIPHRYLSRFCLKGVRSQQGSFTIEQNLKRKTEFFHINLNGSWPELDKYHVIFLRNVMIYFDTETRRKLVARLRNQLLPGGYLIVGHAESMTVLDGGFSCIRPSIYQLR
ncbi:MAG: protein-glutamate O-methyltransferase CheR [Gammaproteobacteria bacterium]|nr:protein-glutamate O-methyltransferase CheR [Gammaproteobacteria bacterium]